MVKISRNASCPCGSGKKYKKCCLLKDEQNSTNSEIEKHIIDEFSFDKSRKEIVHPLFEQKQQPNGTIDIYLFTIGHLWIYELIETHGYAEYLRKLLLYSKNEHKSLFEWELDENDEKKIEIILNEYGVEYKKYLDDKYNVFNHREVINKSKNKDHPYHRLTRLLVLLKMDKDEFEVENCDLKDLLEERGTVINATYLARDMFAKMNKKNLIEMPDCLIELEKMNMECRVDKTHMKYYPKIDTIMGKLDRYEAYFSQGWYLVPENEQVIISKFLYSIRLVKEMVFSLLGTNGILSAFVTRTLFDNYWQSRYLIEKNEVEKYRKFALDRMRLHILKRTDRREVKSIDELLGEVEGGYFDPIPINGDYFTKSAREYSIELGIKDLYDECYEYNSEFIHASLTAVYSGIMAPCINPEHGNHLTIHPGGARLIDSLPQIIEILNKHIILIGKYLGDNDLEELVLEELFSQNREEYYKMLEKMSQNR